MKRTEILMGLMGIAMAITGIYSLMKYGDIANTPYQTISNMILVVGGVLVAVLFRKTLRMGISVGLLAVGTSTVVDRARILVTSYDVIEIVFVTLYLTVAVVVIYCALALMFNASSGSIKGIYGLAIFAILEIGPTIYLSYMGGDLVELSRTNIDDLLDGAMHLVMIFILTREGILTESYGKRMDRNSSYLFNEMCTPCGAYMDVHDMDRLSDERTGWIFHDEGMVESETFIRLYGADYGIRLQRWKGHDDIFFTVSVGDPRSCTVPLSFPITHVVKEYDDVSRMGRVRFYGRDGVFVDILVKNHDDEKKGYIDTIKAYGKERKVQ